MAPSQKPFYIALGVLVVGGAAFIATRIGGSKPVSIPANAVVTAADTSGFHGYMLGAASAPIEISEYADYQCPHCADFDQVQFPDLKIRAIDNGKARLRFRDFPIEGPQSRIAAHAAACANDQGHFWDCQGGALPSAVRLGLPSRPDAGTERDRRSGGLKVPDFEACMQSAKYAGRIQASFDEGTKLGVNGTPSFLIGGRIYSATSSDQIVKLVDSLIAAMPRSGGAAAPTGGR